MSGGQAYDLRRTTVNIGKYGKTGFFLLISDGEHLRATFYIEKNWFWKKKFFAIFGPPPGHPQGYPIFRLWGHISKIASVGPLI